PRHLREEAAMTKEEWKRFFFGHWVFGGARQQGHEAMFPVELPRRLIRMYTVRSDLVLDPFLGSGTTAQVALDLGRNTVGYEINPDFLPLIRERLAPLEAEGHAVEVHQRAAPLHLGDIDYAPALPDLRPLPESRRRRRKKRELFRVSEALGPCHLRLADDRKITLLGLVVPPDLEAETLDYLREYVVGKRVSLRTPLDQQPDAAYVYLKNRLFINRKMIEMGLAQPTDEEHPYLEKFMTAFGK
ncbi:MAG: DNA methyltransferase, partial [Anaerolineae bacterium]